MIESEQETLRFTCTAASRDELRFRIDGIASNYFGKDQAFAISSIDVEIVNTVNSAGQRFISHYGATVIVEAI